MDADLAGRAGILVEVDGPVLVVTIDREDRRNALDPAASHALGRVLDDFESDRRLRLAVLTGAGDVAFCAGGDLKAPPVDGDPMPASGFGGMTHRHGRTKPVIAAVNGLAMGGGFEIALACDVIVAAERALFALPEPRVGLAAMSGGIPRLIRAVGEKRALGMILTGRPVDARRGYEMGFVNEVVPSRDLMTAAIGWAEEILGCSPASIRACLTVADLADRHSVEGVLAATWNGARPGYPWLNDGPDAAEGRRAFAERRSPRWADPA
jgi:enoyl-CoA hydratase/carnithine racemase